MKHYAGLDLSMETTQVCIVDENGRKLLSEKVESLPEAIALVLERYGPIERAVLETGRMRCISGQAQTASGGKSGSHVTPSLGPASQFKHAS